MPASTALGFDRNANSLNRSRRNWQRLALGALNTTINTTSPIVNLGGTLALLIDPNGAISTGANGIGVKVDGSTIAIIGDKLVVIGGGGSSSAVQLVWNLNEIPTGMLDGVNTAFYLQHTPIDVPDVYRDGILLRPGIGNDYTLIGPALNFNAAPASTSALLADYQWAYTGSTAIAHSEPLVGAINGVSSTFTTMHVPLSGTVEVYRDGLRMTVGSTSDYTISGSTVTFTVAPASTSSLTSDYQWTPAFVAPGLLIENELPSGTLNGVNVTFTLLHSPISSTTAVYRDGVRLALTADYTMSGSTITFVVAPASTSNLLADYQY